MKWIIVGFLVISISLLITSRETTDPPDNKSLTLKIEDVSCTEAWIELTTANLPLPATVTIYKDDVGQTISLSATDTVIYVDFLLPNKSCQYQASSREYQVSSNKLSITTLDTTSQNFSFEVLEFGDGFESSYFNDVWVFDENNIWVCGYIYDPVKAVTVAP